MGPEVLLTRIAVALETLVTIARDYGEDATRQEAASIELDAQKAARVDAMLEKFAGKLMDTLAESERRADARLEELNDRLVRIDEHVFSRKPKPS